MQMKKQTIIKLTAALCAASLTFPMTSMADGSGPGFTTVAPPTQTGPGFTDPPSTPPSNPEVTEDASNYYFQTLENPIVRETDKYTYDQMSQDLQTLKATYGNHVQIRSIGKTADGRELYDAIVGNPGAGKHLMIQSGIHAREHMTSLLVMKQLEYALAYYDSGTYNGNSMSSMFDQVAVHFIPMMNPDGISISQWGEGGLGSEELRQVLRDSYQMDLAEGRTASSYNYYLTTWKSNARGVDLNHNFDVGWASLNGSMTHTSATDYKGTAPLSEPEAAALASLVDQYPFKAAINYHAMGQVIYWDTADNRQRETSLAMAQIFARTTGYQILNSMGRGGTKDWLQTKNNAIPSITVEIGRSACPLPLTEFPAVWEQNRSGVAVGMDYTLKNTR